MKDRSFNKLVQLLETVDPTMNQFPAPAQAMEDHEVQMAETQIEEILRNAERIREMLKTLPRNEDIDAWMQSKLTLADDYLVSVAGAMANDFKGVDFALEDTDFVSMTGKKFDKEDFKKRMDALRAKRQKEREDQDAANKSKHPPLPKAYDGDIWDWEQKRRASAPPGTYQGD